MSESLWKSFYIFWRMGDNYLKCSRFQKQGPHPDPLTYQSRVFQQVTPMIWFLVSLLIKWEHIQDKRK
jgi:hypothetical protein